MTEAELRRHASEAQNLLSAPVFRDALKALEDETIEELLATKTMWRWGDRKRRVLADRVNAIRDLKHRLEIAVQMGLHAAERARLGI